MDALVTIIIDGEDISCVVNPRWDDEQEADIDLTLDTNSDEILSEIVPDYHIGSHAVQISDFAGLDEISRMEVSINLSKQDIGKMVKSEFFGRRVEDIRVENLPLRASDSNIASKWMSDLRKYWWKDEFVDVERARIDQEYWSEKLLGSRDPSLIIEGDDLLRELQTSDAFWGVASMIDLMPDKSIRTPFYISEKDDFNSIVSQRVFADIDYSNLKRVVLVDSYPGRFAEIVLRNWMGDDKVEIVFLVNDERYNASNNRLESKDLKTNARIVINNLEKKKAHSRFIIFVDNDDDMIIWNIDNSISQFYVKNGKVLTDASMKFTPESYLYDKNLEKIVRGL